MGVLANLIEVPLWLLMASCIIGAVVGVLFLLLAIWVVDRSGREKTKEVKVKETIDSIVQPVKEVQSAKEVEVTTALPDPEPAILATTPDEPKKKPGPPMRQHYWYYVTGVSGRFATLRDALIASGVKVTDNKLPEWGKLSADKRNGIKRVKVDAEQPVLDEPQEVAKRESARRELEKSLEDLSRMVEDHNHNHDHDYSLDYKPERKPESKVVKAVELDPDVRIKRLGDGCFVTIKKKSK